MPSRRALLHAVAGSAVPLAFGLTGCVGDRSRTTPSEDGSTRTATPTEMRVSPTPTGTARPDCSEPMRPEVPTADEADEVVPQEYPEMPADLTASTAGSFVRQFEGSYVINRAIERNDLVGFQFVSWGVEGSTEVRGGFRVTVGGHVAEYMEYGETATIHGDVWYTAVYLVTPRAVWRTEDGEAVDPTSGELLACSPDS